MKKSKKYKIDNQTAINFFIKNCFIKWSWQVWIYKITPLFVYENNRNMEERMKMKHLKMSKKMKCLFTVYAVLVCCMTFGALPVYAADDPLTVVNNLSDFIFGLIRAVGMILLGFGIVQIGLSLKSHDASQRANGFLTLAGGVIITFAKEILNIITGG